MKVWVAVEGAYSDQYVAGVYASAEQAMAAYPGGWVRRVWARRDEDDWGPNDNLEHPTVTLHEHELDVDAPAKYAVERILVGMWNCSLNNGHGRWEWQETDAETAAEVTRADAV